MTYKLNGNTYIEEPDTCYAYSCPTCGDLYEEEEQALDCCEDNLVAEETEEEAAEYQIKVDIERGVQKTLC